MTWKQRHRSVQRKLIFQQNRGLLLLLAVWLSVSLAILIATGVPFADALLTVLFLREDHSHFGYFYASMTDFVLFGLVISVIMVDIQRTYRPELTCRILAREVTDHAVIISFSNLGRRAFERLTEKDVPVVVIEENRDLVEDVIRGGFPLVLGSGRHRTDLEAANVARAKLVMVACDHLETVMVVCSLVRQMNPDCHLICRCYEDEIGEVLAKRYRVQVISTSRAAADFVKAYAAKNKVQKCIIVGCGQIGRRLIKVMKALNAEYVFIEENRRAVDDLVDEEPFLFGKPSDRDLLREAGAPETDLVILTEDDLSKSVPCIDSVRHMNTSCRIICRVFHDDAADMLSSAPFKCDVISTSRYTLESLISKGAFACFGL